MQQGNALQQIYSKVIEKKWQKFAYVQINETYSPKPCLGQQQTMSDFFLYSP